MKINNTGEYKIGITKAILIFLRARGTKHMKIESANEFSKSRERGMC